MAGQARTALNGNQRRAKATGPGVRITWDGVTYTIHQGEIPATIALELRQQAQIPLNQLWGMIAADGGYDLVGILIWLAKRVGGEQVTLNEVLERITDGTEMDIGGVDATATPADPVTIDGEAVSPNV
jgi:hypothetical protein